MLDVQMSTNPGKLSFPDLLYCKIHREENLELSQKINNFFSQLRLLKSLKFEPLSFAAVNCISNMFRRLHAS